MQGDPASMAGGPLQPTAASPSNDGESSLRGVAQRLQVPALSALLAAVNHLLGQHAWARHKLAMHARKHVRFGLDGSLFGLPAPELWALISPDGLLVLAGAETAPPEPALALLLRPSVEAVFAAARDGAQGLSRHLRVEGDVMLAATLGELVQQVRWDPEEDLSRVVGDAAAHRIGQAAGQARVIADDLRRRLERTAVSFLTVEQPQLVSRSMVDGWVAQVSALVARLDAIERRITRLDHKP